MRPEAPNDLRAALASQLDIAAKVNQSVQDMLDALRLDWSRKLWIPYSSGCCVSDARIASRPVIVRSLSVYNQNQANSWFVQAHNEANKPADGKIPVIPPLPLASNSVDAFELPEDGILFSQGLYICGSSTDIQKTLITTADLFIYALYRFA
jgi:hypothetical protein